MLPLSFTDIDIALGKFIAVREPRADGVVAHSAQLVSAGVQSGSVCINLCDFAGKSVADERRGLSFCLPPLEEWCAILAASSMVATKGEYRPLVLDEFPRLYLHRYWSYERCVADFIRERMAAETKEFTEDFLSHAQAVLGELFPECSAGVDWQKVAVAASLFKSTLIISGGPGTGKTTTAAKVIAAAISFAQHGIPRIALCAPTGKASIRLREAVKEAKKDIPRFAAMGDDFLKNSLTIHRLLGYGGNMHNPRHNRRHSLPYDLLIVDEASMIDLPLMAHLVEAIPPGTKLILLGDKHQLASVEPGAIFGDINEAIAANTFSGKTAPLIRRLCGGGMTPVVGAGLEGVVELQKNYRFGDCHPLAKMGELINAGKVEQALECVRSASPNSLKLVEPGDPSNLRQTILAWQEEYIAALLAREPVERLFALLGQMRLLTVLRQGRHGAETLNRDVVLLWEEEKIIRKGAVVFPGMPIMANKNNHRQGVFNGDIGIVLFNEEGTPIVHFQGIAGEMRLFPLGSLESWEMAFAMTVHKAQGSEFERVMLLLPDADSPVLTREVIYTAITRARSAVEIWGSEEMLRLALKRKTSRHSALRERLCSCP